MRTILGADFAEPVADLVDQLVKEAEKLAGVDNFYLAYGGICFARKRRGSSNRPGSKFPSKAVGIFTRINPQGDGAVLIRPRVPKSGDHEYAVTPQNIDYLLRVVRSWYDETRPGAKPVGKQGTGSHNILPGGRPESDHSRF